MFCKYWFISFSACKTSAVWGWGFSIKMVRGTAAWVTLSKRQKNPVGALLSA